MNQQTVPNLHRQRSRNLQFDEELSAGTQKTKNSMSRSNTMTALQNKLPDSYKSRFVQLQETDQKQQNRLQSTITSALEMEPTSQEEITQLLGDIEKHVSTLTMQITRLEYAKTQLLEKKVQLNAKLEQFNRIQSANASPPQSNSPKRIHRAVTKADSSFHSFDDNSQLKQNHVFDGNEKNFASTRPKDESNKFTLAFKHKVPSESTDEIKIIPDESKGLANTPLSVFNEVLQSEKAYFAELSDTVLSFCAPMKRSGKFSDHVVYDIFSNIESILTLHKGILDQIGKLDTSVEPSKFTTELVNVFLKTEHFFEFYAVFATNEKISSSMLSFLGKHNDFKKFLSDQKKPILKLERGIARPIERMLQLIGSFGRLANMFENDSETKQLIQKFVNSLRETLNVVKIMLERQISNEDIKNLLISKEMNPSDLSVINSIFRGQKVVHHAKVNLQIDSDPIEGLIVILTTKIVLKYGNTITIVPRDQIEINLVTSLVNIPSPFKAAFTISHPTVSSVFTVVEKEREIINKLIEILTGKTTN